MNLLTITDVGNGRVVVSWQRGNAVPIQYPGLIPFADPMTDEDRKELRWYLEKYLEFPFGAEDWRAKQVEKKMAGWGESLFKQVFVKADEDPDPHALYSEAVHDGLKGCELCVCSEDADFLNIPWELLRDPTAGKGYLAPLLGGLYRQRRACAISHEDEERGGPFRILLVIARPYGERDVPLGTVSRPVLQAIRPLRPQVELEVLRPPTFEALEKRLRAKPGHFDLVHFDGHGVFAGASRGQLGQFGARADAGHLVFENEDGSEHVVNSQDLGQALAECRVPLFVLNACQSGQEGRSNPFSSVSSQLVAVGAKGVVAMSYSVYAKTAALFMRRFYEELVGGASLAAAAAGGRRTLQEKPHRPSVVGDLELSDWIVPVLYQREIGYTPILKGKRKRAKTDQAEESVVKKATDACPEGQFGFIGRDYDILRIERALRDPRTPWVLISGIGGVGKTELAFGFARWFAETGGCPGGVFATDFKTKADFGQVIGSVAGFGTDFSRLSDDEQWKRLVGSLRENPCLLVWDNFETVAGYPYGADALATDDERQKLSRFLTALRGGKSRVVITSRKPDERWAEAALQLVEIGGLTYWDAAELAKAILSTVGRRPDEFKGDPDYARLVELLKGHPRSMEVTLPLLRTKSPREVIDALQHKIDDESMEVEDASLALAFSQMSERARKHLPFIGLFATNVHAGMPGEFPRIDDDKRKLYEEAMGEVIDTDAWRSILDEAHRAGLIGHEGGGIYRLHPTLPAFLRRKLKELAGTERMECFDVEFVRFYAMWAGGMLENARNANPGTLRAISVEEGNLLRALRIAEIRKTWAEAQAIAEPLREFYEARGRMDEWRALRGCLLTTVGQKMTKDSQPNRASLWAFLVTEKASDLADRNQLDSAETAYNEVLDYYVSLKDPSIDPQIALCYQGLGTVAEEREHLDEAEVWYQKALDILLELSGLERDAARTWHQLGNTAFRKGQLKKAIRTYWKALEVLERLGLEREAADVYHQLGILAGEGNLLDEAEELYDKALEILERLGLEREAARTYHQLGVLSDKTQRFDEAEAWYRKALYIYERLGHPSNLVATLGQMGVLRVHQGRLDEAVSWMGKAYAIAAEYKTPDIEKTVRNTAILMKKMGEEAFVAAWREAFEGQEPPLEELRAIIGKMGEKG